MLSDKKTKYPVIILLTAITIFIIIWTVRNGGINESEDRYTLSEEEYLEGKKLSQTYCAGCHLYPDPDLLPKETWISETLPAMGPMLGITRHNGLYYTESKTPYLPRDFYPSEPQLSSEEWQTILNYYEDLAPEELPPAERNPEIVTDSLFFKARTPNDRPDSPPIVTAVKFDPGNRLIYLSDARSRSFLVFDENLELKNRFNFSTPISDIQFLEDPGQAGMRHMLFTYIGHLDPSDAPLGSVSEGWYDPETGEGDIQSDLYRDSLTRPVESQSADLDEDGLEDLLIGEFGHRTGRLSWLKNHGESFGPERNVLIEKPGCIQSHITDFAGNGLPDIVSLCTQVDQSIYLFKNLGNGEFERERLIQFDITAGSSSFELHDFNSDGHPDILYTSGDNADFSKIYKPYHGVYIYLNDGNNNFSEEWFYPVNGAYRAVASDFNQDSHVDIAVISYFADYVRRPEESFLLFKNEGELTFTPYHHPSTMEGRWLTMDVADWTGNGYDDILLANFSEGPIFEENLFRRDWREGPRFLLLENQGSEK